MANFNYMPHSPYVNPAGGIEKTTNELPAKKKATTRVKKAEKPKKTKAKRARKKKIVESE